MSAPIAKDFLQTLPRQLTDEDPLSPYSCESPPKTPTKGRFMYEEQAAGRFRRPLRMIGKQHAQHVDPTNKYASHNLSTLKEDM